MDKPEQGPFEVPAEVQMKLDVIMQLMRLLGEDIAVFITILDDHTYVIRNHNCPESVEHYLDMLVTAQHVVTRTEDEEGISCGPTMN